MLFDVRGMLVPTPCGVSLLGKSVLLLLCLGLLFGCSVTPRVPPTAPVQELVVPLDLLAPCPSPVLLGDSYGDFVTYSLDASLALKGCNERIRVIRGIVEEHNARPQ